VRGRIPGDRPAAVAMVSVANGRPVVVVAVNDKGREWGVKAGELVRVAALTARLREVEKDLERLRSAQVLEAAGQLAASPTDVFGVGVVTHRAPDGTAADDLRRLVLDVRGRIPGDRPAAVAMVAVTNDRPVVVVAVNDKGREWGVKAGELVRVAAGVLGGGGGGKDDVAQGGGTDPAKVDDALRSIEHTVGQRVTGSA